MTCGRMAPLLAILGSNVGIVPADGETIARRIRINRPDGENARCKASRARAQPRDFSLLTQPSITSSTSNATSHQPKRTEAFAPRRWTRGARWLRPLEDMQDAGSSRPSLDNVTMPCCQLAAQRSPALHIKRLVNGLVTDAHRLVVGKVVQQALGYLFWAPCFCPPAALPRPMPSTLPDDVRSGYHRPAFLRRDVGTTA